MRNAQIGPSQRVATVKGTDLFDRVSLICGRFFSRITGRKRAERVGAEEDLRLNEDRLRLIIDTIPTMAWSLTPDGTVDFVNQRWSDYTGISLEDELEAPTRAMHPEDLPGAVEKWLVTKAAGRGASENGA